MSYDSRIVVSEDQSKNEKSIAVFSSKDAHIDSTVSYTSSLFVQLRQLQNDIQTQHKREKHALNELNDKFRYFIDRVQQLEAQNAQYMTQLAKYQRPTANNSGANFQLDEHYLRLQSDIKSLSHNKMDLGLEFEMYQLQIAIYQQLIEFEHQWKDDRRAKLEQELNQTSSTLNSIRVSNSELGREVESLHISRDNAYQQYMKLTQDWCRIKKQGQDWDLNLKLLRNQVAFYKSLRSYSSSGTTIVPVDTSDVQKFWALELDKAIKNIRHDFEQLYSSFYKEMTAYYTQKEEILRTEIKRIETYIPHDTDEWAISYQRLQVDYEKIEKSYSYEKELFTKLEAHYAKLESEFQIIQQQNDERFDILSRDLQSFQENILMTAYEIEEMRRKKVYLESEIIIYRNLLEANGVSMSSVRPISPQLVPTTMTRKFVVKSQKKGNVGIRECPPDGSYISLLNYSPEKDADLSRWVIRRILDRKNEIRYTIPNGTQLRSGGEIRIYSKQGAAIARSPSSQRSSISSRQELVNSDITTWGSGNVTETSLFNHNGEEKAIFTQSIAINNNST